MMPTVMITKMCLGMQSLTSCHAQLADISKYANTQQEWSGQALTAWWANPHNTPGRVHTTSGVGYSTQAQ